MSHSGRVGDYNSRLAVGENSINKTSESGTNSTQPLQTHSRKSGPKMSVVVVRELSELVNYVADWQLLADGAIEPNVFYEPWFLLPAMEAFAGGHELKFVLIFVADRSHPSGLGTLCGFFPIERQHRFRGLPTSVLRLWRHIHCYLCTPLLKTGYARECLKSFFEWLAESEQDCPLVEFGLIRGDGPFNRLLVDYFYENSKLTYITECHTRALFQPAVNANVYLQGALTLKQRKLLKRRETKLAETGRLEYLSLDVDEDVSSWTEQFLRLEASGWKGREGSALACDATNRAFFEAVTMGAFQRRRLLMLALAIDGQPIAQRFGLLAEPGSFSFKIAFDEDYRHFSPGVLLHLENIRRLHARPEIRWMDSCTAADNAMLNRLWPHRRTILSLVVGTGRNSGDFVVTLMPLLRWLKRKLPARASTS